jgi:hypothetical protein
VYREGGWLADGVMAVCPECRQVLEGTMGWHAQHEKVCDWVPAGTWLKKRVAAERRKWEMSAESGAAVLAPAMSDPIDHPKHYTSHPANIECIAVVEHLGFCVGNAIKYLWRAGLKGDAIEDLKKARWYVDREIARRSSPSGSGAP